MSLPVDVSVSLRLRVSCAGFQFEAQRRVVSVSGIGSEACRILQQSRSGHVLAVFRRCFYLQCDQGIVCVGSALLGNGPLHVLLASDSDDWLAYVSCGQLVSVGEDTRLPCKDNGINSAHASFQRGHTTYSGSVLSQGSLRFSEWHTLILEQCGACIAEHGLGWLLKQQCWHPDQGLSEIPAKGLDAFDLSLQQLCFAPLQALYGWLAESLGYSVTHPAIASRYELTVDTDELVCAPSNAPSSIVHKLLGAGPGLTPAGDDLLAGVMLALYSIRRADMARLLWIALQPWLVRRTNAISIAHLRLASQGQCSETMLRLLELFSHERTCGSADDVQDIVRTVQKYANKMGASSGWDTLAGVSLVVRAMLADSTHVTTTVNCLQPDASQYKLSTPIVKSTRAFKRQIPDVKY